MGKINQYSNIYKTTFVNIEPSLAIHRLMDGRRKSFFLLCYALDLRVMSLLCKVLGLWMMVEQILFAVPNLLVCD